MAKKIAEISFMYQPWATRPQMMAASPSTKITITAFCLPVNSLSRRFSSAPNSLRFSISSWKAGDASGFFLTLRAYITTHAMATAVSTTRAIVRNQSWGLPWIPRMPWEIRTLNGFTVDAMYPIRAPTNTVMNAVIESKPMAIMIGIRIAKNGSVSSAIPKVLPPKAKSTIRIGMMRTSLLLNFFTTRATPLVMAPVAVMTWKEPPTIIMNATTSTACWMPIAGASSTSKMPWRRSTSLPSSSV